MKAYNTPKDEMLIKSDEGEELVKITPEKTTIANLEGGGGSGLPPVTSDDNGKLLQVDNGEWEASTYPVSYNEEVLYSNTFTITQEMIDEYQNSVDLMDTSLASADFSSANQWAVTINGHEATYRDKGRGEYEYSYESASLQWSYYGGTLDYVSFKADVAGEYTLVVKNSAQNIDSRFSQAVSKITGLETFEPTGDLSKTFGVNGGGEWVPTPLVTVPSQSRDTLFAAIYKINGSIRAFIPILDLQSVPDNNTLIYALSVRHLSNDYTISGKQMPNIPLLSIGDGNGTYVLKGIVTSNGVTFEWVRES